MRTAGREYVEKCLEEVEILHSKGCKVQGKWTPSHQGISGNKRTETHAKAGLLESKCEWTRTTLAWVRAQPHNHLAQDWRTEANLRFLPRTKLFEGISSLPRKSPTAISRLHCSLIAMDPSPMKPPTPGACGDGICSVKQILLECITHHKARDHVFASHKGPKTWESITDANINSKEQLHFMATTGLQRVMAIIDSPEDARDAGYEIGEDI